MKRYKLLKDLPTFKSGQLAYVSSLGNLMAGTPEEPETTDTGLELMMYHRTTLKKFPEILTEWFEEIQEPTDSINWKPKEGDNYFYIVDSYNPLHNEILVSTWVNDDYDKTYYLLGNIYRSYKEAEKARNRKLAEARLRRTSTFKPDFEKGRDGYIVVYDQMLCVLDSISCSYRYGQIVHYETKEEAEKSIKENERDWKIYFGIEEEK